MPLPRNRCIDRYEHFGLVSLFILTMIFSLPGLANTWAQDIERCSRLQASKNEAGVDLTDRFAVEFAILDHLQLHIPWFEAQLKTIDRKVDPLRWMRVAWAIAMTGRLQPDDLKDAQAIALEKKLYLEYAGLTENQFDSLQQLSSNSSEYLAAIRDTLAQIEALGNTEATAYMYGNVALVLLRQRMVDQALPFIDKAVSLNERPEVRSPIIDYRVKSALGTSFALRKLLQEEQETNAQISQRLRSCGIRGVLAILMYSRSNLLLQHENPDFLAIDKAIEEAHQLATETQSKLGIGLALYSKSWAERLRLRFESATQAIQEALGYFEASKMSNWVAKGTLRAAQIDLAAGRYTMALAKVETVRPGFPPDNREAHNDLDWIAYQAQRALGQSEAALVSLDRFVTTYRELAKQREKEEYNKAAASIGLQLEQERSKNLQQDLALKATLLKQAEQVKRFTMILGGVLLALIFALAFAWRQMQIAKRRRDQVAMILNGIDEGLMTVMEDHKIGLDYSLFTHTLFERDASFANDDFFALLAAKTSLQSEERSMIEQIFSATFGEDALAWELNAANLPKSFRVKSSTPRILNARWIPIFDTHQKLLRILISLRDVTKERELESTVGMQEKALRDLPQTLQEVVANHQPRTREFLRDLAAWLAEARSGRVNLRHLHTLKGLARAFSFRILSQEIHELESQLQKRSYDSTGPELFHRLALSLRDYQQFMDILSQEKASARQDDSIWFGRLLEPALLEFMARASRENLPVSSITVCDGVQDWSQLDRSVVEGFFVHGLSNTLDHGFLYPRKKGINLAPLEIRLTAVQSGQQLSLELEDNGAGFDLTGLRALAQQRGLVDLRDEDLPALVWEEHVSTALVATTTSGRGMGLAAVKDSIVALGGTISLQPRAQGSGTLLRAAWYHKQDPNSSPLDVA